MHAPLLMVRQSPPLRFLARVLTFALIALPLVNLAGLIESTINRTSALVAMTIVGGFGLLLATTLVFVKLVFRTVP
jgi:hypothetical protein